MKSKQKVLLIGSGLGALATALRLVTSGYEVEVVEKFNQPGGRLNLIKQDGFSFDSGPSFFSMSYEFKELFDSCSIPNPLQLNELNPLYAVYFEGREKPFLIFKDLKKLEQEFAGTEPDLALKTKKYLERAGKMFHDTEHLVIRRNFDNKFDYFLSLARVPLRHSPKMFRSLWEDLDRNFESHEIKVIFSLVSFFLGSTPFQTPAIYSLLNYTEMIHDGYWNVQGGMYTIVEKIKELLDTRGVKFHFNTEITGFEKEGDRIAAFYDQNGKRWSSDLFVVNSDAASFRGKVLQRPGMSTAKLDSMEWTLAPFTIYLGVKGKLDQVHHHNYFLGTNFKEYSTNILKTSTAPQKPYYYVNMSSRSNPQCTPDGCENLFILCPVPDLRFKSDWSDSESFADTIIADLSSRINFDLRGATLTRKIMNPIDWQNQFNLYRGSGLGLAHGLNQVGAFRPSNKDELFSNLYYVGASTVPGSGLPMVVISSKLVTDRIRKDHERV